MTSGHANEDGPGWPSAPPISSGSMSYDHIFASGMASQHNGPVFNTNFNYHLPPFLATGDSQSERRIVFPRNIVQSYVERSFDGGPITEAILTHLDLSVSEASRPAVAVLLGMGGAGKTQIALRCSEKLRENESVRSLFWIDAYSNNSIAKSFVEIAKLITRSASSTDSEDSKEKALLHNMEKTVDLVLQYLESHPRWVLVFDNFDHPKQIEPNGKLRTIHDYWPNGGAGAVLILSRNHVCTNLGKPFDVGRMSESECIQVLRNYVTRATDDAEEDTSLKDVAHTLGYLALASAQAGAYIQSRGISAKQFLLDYSEQSDEILRRIPDGPVWEYHRINKEDEPLPQSVFTTWELSLSCLSGSEEEKLHKQNFICFCGFLDASALREDLFRRFHDYPLDQPLVEPSAWDDIFLMKGVWSSYRFRNVVAELKGLSLLESSSGDEDIHFTIHPLVSEWIKCRLSPQKASAHLQDVCHLLVGSTLGVGVDQSQHLEANICRFLAMHAVECARNCPRFLTDCCLAAQGPLEDTGMQMAGLIWVSGRLQDSLLISERALRWKAQRKEAWSQHYFLMALYRTRQLRVNGQVQEAADLLQELCEWHKTEALICVEDSIGLSNDMGMSLNCMHRYEDALGILRINCDEALRELGREHWLYASCLVEMAKACESLGRLDDAKSYAQEAHTQLISRLGPDDGEVACIEGRLFDIYVKQNKYQEAVNLFEINVKKSEKQYGLSHPNTLRWHLHITEVYARLGRKDDALQCINLVLELASKDDTPLITRAHIALGLVSIINVDLNTAESSLDTAISYLRSAGALHSDNAIACCGYRHVCFALRGSLASAEGMWRDVLKELKRCSQPGNPDHAKEAHIYFALFAVLRGNIHSPDINKRAELRKLLDRAIQASQQAQTALLTKSERLNTAIRAYGEFKIQALVNKYSEILLALWSQQESLQLYSGPADITKLNLACSISLPPPITNLCDFILSIRRYWPAPQTISPIISAFSTFFFRRGDLANARIALELLPALDVDARSPQPSYSCDLKFCGSEQGIMPPIWRCTTCPDVSLCSPCYTQYKRTVRGFWPKGASSSGCFGHDFLEVPQESSRDPDDGKIGPGKSFETWLGEIERTYRHSDPDFDTELAKLEFDCVRKHYEDDKLWPLT